MSQIDAPRVATRHTRAALHSAYRTAQHIGVALLIGILCASCASAPEHAHGAERAALDAQQHSVTKDASPPRASAPSATAPAAAQPGKVGAIGQKWGVSSLTVPEFGPAILVVPEGSGPLPLLVATHGAGGDPAWECERWSPVAKARYILLCPRGAPLRRGQEGSYFYPDHHALEREVTASVKAARDALGARLRPAGGVYVGYSQGATMGSLMLVDHGSEFSHLLLIEGGSADWTAARAARFRATGGSSVFIVCGTKPCAERATRAKPVLERAGLRAEVRVVADGGHTELGPVGKEAENLLESLAAP
jgi:predicted esterase